MSNEAEMIGIRVGLDQLQVICNRYYFAGLFVKDKRVLEVGCGSGIGLGYLAQRAESVIGGDYSSENLKVAKEYNDSLLIQFDAHSLPFQDKSFDVIVAMATIIYLDLDKFFAECSRVLRPNGILIFCTPNKDQPHFQPSKQSRNYQSVPELAQRVNRHFNAEFFGIFPIVPAKTRLISQYRNFTIAIMGKILPVTIKNKLHELLIHDITLTPELIKRHIVSQAYLQSIPQNIPDFSHRVIYAKCNLREAT